MHAHTLTQTLRPSLARSLQKERKNTKTKNVPPQSLTNNKSHNNTHSLLFIIIIFSHRCPLPPCNAPSSLPTINPKKKKKRKRKENNTPTSKTTRTSDTPTLISFFSCTLADITAHNPLPLPPPLSLCQRKCRTERKTSPLFFLLLSSPPRLPLSLVAFVLFVFEPM